MINTACELKQLSRHEKEMGIQISEMEKYKFIASQNCGFDVGKNAYFEWTSKYSKKVRNWLDTLSDQEIDKCFEALSGKLKNTMMTKTR